MAWTRFNSAIINQGETWLRAVATNYPLPESFLLTLHIANGTISRTSTKAQVLATELALSNGYARRSLVFPVGTYDLTQQRGEWLAADVSIPATGQSLQYDAAVIWALPSGQTLPSGGWCELLNIFGSTQTILDGTEHTFKVSWNSLNAGDVSGV